MGVIRCVQGLTTAGLLLRLEEVLDPLKEPMRVTPAQVVKATEDLSMLARSLETWPTVSDLTEDRIRAVRSATEKALVDVLPSRRDRDSVSLQEAQALVRRSVEALEKLTRLSSILDPSATVAPSSFGGTRVAMVDVQDQRRYHAYRFAVAGSEALKSEFSTLLGEAKFHSLHEKLHTAKAMTASVDWRLDGTTITLLVGYGSEMDDFLGTREDKLVNGALLQRMEHSYSPDLAALLLSARVLAKENRGEALSNAEQALLLRLKDDGVATRHGIFRIGFDGLTWDKKRDFGSHTSAFATPYS